MRLLVFEFVSGGGMAGRPASPSLVREGRAMRDALVEDLAALRIHDIVTTADPRFPLKRIPRGVEVIPLRRAGAALDGLFRETDAAWLIAPETGGCLESLATRASRNGARLLGPSARAIRRAADKASLPGRLAAEGVPPSGDPGGPLALRGPPRGSKPGLSRRDQARARSRLRGGHAGCAGRPISPRPWPERSAPPATNARWCSASSPGPRRAWRS